MAFGTIFGVCLGAHVFLECARFKIIINYLAADAEVCVGDELRLIVAVVLSLHERVQHTHSDSWQSHQERQQLPGLP